MESEPKKSNQKLTAEQREEATRRVLAGEKASDLAQEYGCTAANIRLLKAYALFPERYKLKAESQLKIRLTKQEIAELQRAFDTSTPEENELIPARDSWSLDHGFQLTMKRFGKKPSLRAMKECMGDRLTRRPDHGDPKPKPPKPAHINQLDPEMAKDADFVAYYLSPTCAQIRQREYECALAEWELRNPNGEGKPMHLGDEPSFSAPRQTLPPAPGQRVGKHAKSKGNPFTPPKKRRKNKR